jgi:hypothetical protein
LVFLAGVAVPENDWAEPLSSSSLWSMSPMKGSFLGRLTISIEVGMDTPVSFKTTVCGSFRASTLAVLVVDEDILKITHRDKTRRWM